MRLKKSGIVSILCSLLSLQSTAFAQGGLSDGGGEILRSRFTLGLDRAITALEQVQEIEGDNHSSQTDQDQLKETYRAYRLAWLDRIKMIKKAEVEILSGAVPGAEASQIAYFDPQSQKIQLSRSAFAQNGMTADDAAIAGLELSARASQVPLNAEGVSDLSKELLVQSVAKGLVEGVRPENLAQYLGTGQSVVLSLEEYGQEPVLIDTRPLRGYDMRDSNPDILGLALEVRQMIFDSLKAYQSLYGFTSLDSVALDTPRICVSSPDEIVFGNFSTKGSTFLDLLCMTDNKYIDRRRIQFFMDIFNDKFRRHFMGRIGNKSAPDYQELFMDTIVSLKEDVDYPLTGAMLGFFRSGGHGVSPRREKIKALLRNYGRGARYRAVRLLEAVTSLPEGSKYALAYSEFRDAWLKVAKEEAPRFWYGLLMSETPLYDNRHGNKVEVAAITTEEEWEEEVETGFFIFKLNRKIAKRGKAILFNIDYFEGNAKEHGKDFLNSPEERDEISVLVLHEFGHMAGATEASWGESVHDILDGMSLELLEAYNNRRAQASN